MKKRSTSGSLLGIVLVAFFLCFLVTGFIAYILLGWIAMFVGGLSGMEVVSNRTSDLIVTVGLVVAGVLIFMIFNKFRK